MGYYNQCTNAGNWGFWKDGRKMTQLVGVEINGVERCVASTCMVWVKHSRDHLAQGLRLEFSEYHRNVAAS
jgi:hypothetical protein